MGRSQSQPVILATYSSICRLISDHEKNLNCENFIRMIEARGLNKITSLVLPLLLNDGYLELLAAICPELKSLSLKGYLLHDRSVLPGLIKEWKLLEELTIEFRKPRVFPKLAAQIVRNCQSFNSLVVLNSIIGEEDALAIGNYLPELKKLSLMCCDVEQENLEIIISTCKHLEFLDVYKGMYRGIWDDKKLKELASHIKSFNLSTSTFW